MNIEFENDGIYSEKQIYDLIDQSIICGTTRDLYDKIVLGVIGSSKKENILVYLMKFMENNHISGYNLFDSNTTNKKISDIIAEHRDKKIDLVVK